MSKSFESREQLRHRLRDSLKRTIGVFCLSMVGLLPTGDTARGPELTKLEGPYVGPGPARWGDQGPYVYKELYESKQARAITLADDMDGLLMSEGFTLGYNKASLTSKLERDEVAILAQVAQREDGEEIIDSTMVVSESFDYDLLHNGSDERDKLVRQAMRQTEEESVGEYSLSPKWKARGYDSFGFMINAATPEESQIEVSRYRFHRDGTFTRMDRKQTTATIIDNVSCGPGAPEKVTSEVVLTPAQHQLACTAIDRYANFYTDDTRVLLDSIGHPFFSQNGFTNAYGLFSKNISLAFPYEAKKEVLKDVFGSTILHESLHAAFHQLKPGSQVYVEVHQAYKNQEREMKYKLPSPDEQQASKVRVSDVEPVWRVITEAAYQSDNGGHPWDSPTEMTSSTAAVLAFYPEQFLRQFAELNDSEQAAIKQVVKVTAKLIEEFEDDVTNIIPKYEMILEALEHSK